MSDATANGETGDGGKANGKGKMIKLAGLGGGGLVAVLAALYFFMGGSNSSTTTASLNGEMALQPAPVVFFEVPELTVNLSAAGGKQQYLKLKIALELPNQAMSRVIEPVMPRVLDTFQVYLRELRAEDLKGSAGMFRLKDELRKRVNTAVSPAKVNAILFQEMLVQ